jgi:hypothetical protein
VFLLPINLSVEKANFNGGKYEIDSHKKDNIPGHVLGLTTNYNEQVGTVGNELYHHG